STNNLKLVERLQRSALRTTPTVALEIILGLPPLDLYCRGVAAVIGRRLWASGQWCGSDTGHSSTLGKFENVKDIDYMMPHMTSQ
ncbi:hypothetical protein DOY81_006674, partial [Sarcophaga bullata]